MGSTQISVVITYSFHAGVLDAVEVTSPDVADWHAAMRPDYLPGLLRDVADAMRVAGHPVPRFDPRPTYRGTRLLLADYLAGDC